ncbi:MAG: hypothetical protein Q9174_005775 [Haloplaca sp. 1 TL-2023]
MSSAVDSGLNKLCQDLFVTAKSALGKSSTYFTNDGDGRTQFFHIAAGLVAGLLIYTFALVFYRLFLSPIAAFPGPKLAAATEWYEFYYQLVQDGQWGRQIARLHDQYDSHHLSVPHDLHRQRRRHLDSFFSRQGINRTEDMVANAARQLAERLQALEGSGTVVKLDDVFSALTGDIIANVACGANPGLLEDANFSPEW